MQVTLVPGRHVNGDLGVVNAARVSFAKERDTVLLHGDPRIPAGESGDDRLINYLARHQHWSPLAHPHFAFNLTMSATAMMNFAVHQPAGVRLIPYASATGGRHYMVGSFYGLAKALKYLDDASARLVNNTLMKRAPLSSTAVGLEHRNGSTMGWRVDDIELRYEAENHDNDLIGKGLIRTFRIEAPVFVARQLVKHQRDLVWNEESRRYIDRMPDFYQPQEWREAPDNKKQGSGGPLPEGHQTTASRQFERVITATASAYADLLALGVAPEQARMALPVSHMTEWWWTGSVDAWARVVRLRLDAHAQGETALIAQQIDTLLAADLGPLWDKIKQWEANRE